MKEEYTIYFDWHINEGGCIHIEAESLENAVAQFKAMDNGDLDIPFGAIVTFAQLDMCDKHEYHEIDLD